MSAAESFGGMELWCALDNMQSRPFHLSHCMIEPTSMANIALQFWALFTFTNRLLYSFFTLLASVFSFLTVYALSRESHGEDMIHREKPAMSRAEGEINPQSAVGNGFQSENVV